MKKPENSAITITIHSKEHKKNSLNELKKVKVIEIMENIHAYSFDPSNNPLSLEDSFEMSSERQKSGDETKKKSSHRHKKGIFVGFATRAWRICVVKWEKLKRVSSLGVYMQFLHKHELQPLCKNNNKKIPAKCSNFSFRTHKMCLVIAVNCKIANRQRQIPSQLQNEKNPSSLSHVTMSNWEYLNENPRIAWKILRDLQRCEHTPWCVTHEISRSHLVVFLAEETMLRKFLIKKSSMEGGKQRWNFFRN